VPSDPQRSALERTTSAVFTAHAEADTVEQIFAAGADDCVSKPIMGPKLVTASLTAYSEPNYCGGWLKLML